VLFLGTYIFFSQFLIKFRMLLRSVENKEARKGGKLIKIKLEE
jgi:hypothetical protein